MSKILHNQGAVSGRDGLLYVNGCKKGDDMYSLADKETGIWWKETLSIHRTRPCMDSVHTSRIYDATLHRWIDRRRRPFKHRHALIDRDRWHFEHFFDIAEDCNRCFSMMFISRR